MKGKSSKSDFLTSKKNGQRRIGITGGIASGKSSVANYLKKIKGFPIIDADVYSHEALGPETSYSNSIIERYGEKVVKSNKNNGFLINRIALRKIIFNNKKEKKWIENLLHKSIIRKIEEEIEKLKLEPTIILVIPLLYELKLDYMCTEVWLINCTLEQQLERLVDRDEINKEDALKMIKSQISLEEKQKISKVIIDNSCGIEGWKDQVNSII